MIPTTLVVGGCASEREAAIAAALAPGVATAIILEGLSDADSALAGTPTSRIVRIVRIAPGCPCCTGKLVLSVTLNRLLRHPPAQLFISLANPTHLEQLRSYLSAAPYDRWLSLGADINHGKVGSL